LTSHSHSTDRHPQSLSARGNLFRADPTGQALFAGWLGADWAELQPLFDRIGAAAAEAEPLSAEADRIRPRLVNGSTSGNGARGGASIEYSPGFRALDALAHATEIVQRRNDLDFLVRHGARRNLVSIGTGYYFAQTEIALMCQMGMTGGMGVILERYAPPDLARRILPRLGHPDPALRLRGAMFLSERQGGSDLGSIGTTAVPTEGPRWRITGEKAFCSNVDAEAILVLARLPGGGSGTRGLGLFLVLRDDPPSNGDSIHIHRLLPKLGVGSTATGDVALVNTEGHLIAGASEGFKRMAEMINLTRVYNATASLAGLRRALLEALAYGSERRAFGERLWDLPLWRASMADLAAEHLGAFLLTFATIRALDATDSGDAIAARELRLLTPMAKALTGKLAVFGVSECMEAVGGAGYLEDSILPRLLRDVQVLPIWEGSTNIVTLDALRALARERAHEAFFDRLRRALAAAPAGIPGEWTGHVTDRMRADAERLEDLSRATLDDAQRDMRGWLESAGRTATLAFLLEGAATPAVRDICLAAFQRLRARPYSVMPLVASTGSALSGTEAVLLHGTYAATG
jgi:acyl-CoA dehydrogenase